MSWNIIYEYSSGEKPVEDFIKSLSLKSISKITWMLDLLEVSGNLLRMPYSKKITQNIFELRVKGAETIRILYTFGSGKNVYLLHGFKKKTQKTPVREIKLAEERRKRYLTSI